MINLKTPVIIDDFFEDPDLIREIALNAEYKDCKSHEYGGDWPGKRSDFLNNILDKDIFDKFIFKLFEMSSPNEIPHSDYYIESYFQCCVESDGDSWIHTDELGRPITTASVIYLTPNPAENSGTILYEPINQGFDPYQMSNPKNYIEKNVIENKYNRMITYDTREFHKSDTYFGNNIDNCRITIVSFFITQFTKNDIRI